jgi:Domain of unknown function (DUF4226)
MSGPKRFGDVTHWDVWNPKTGTEGWSQPGWALPADPTRYISRNDAYWNRILDDARQAYGDPTIRYSSDSTGEGRRLVFGDGTDLPADGTIVYHDAATGRNWSQNDDGTMSLLGADGRPGTPVTAAGYRKIGDHYAPVNDSGQQIAPQLGGIPSNDNGFHTDPMTGALTPKNSRGDYYTLGSDGKKSFFDDNGAPISAEQFDNPSKPRDRGQPPDAELPTEEQQSGKAAEAVAKLQRDLNSHYSKISDAEEKLSEVLLTVHATTAEGQQKLNEIQKKIVDAVNTPTVAVDTPAGERSFVTFLRNQVSDIDDLLASGSLSAQDQTKAAHALAALYTADAGAPADPPAAQPPSPPPAAAAPDPPLGADPGLGAPGLGSAPLAPDPGLSDLLGAAPAGGDPLSSLASMLPALGGLGGGAPTSPLDGLAGLGGAASPLAGLASQPGEHGGNDRPADNSDDSPPRAKDAKNSKEDKADPAQADTTPPAGGQPQPAGQQGQNPTAGGEPPSPVVPPAAASATVKLPDGSTATARNPQTAEAIRDYLAGETVDASYRKNGIELPPLGTPITHPVDPSRLTCGDLAMFKDHYVPALSSVKAYLNGQVVPLGSVASSPDFLGWIDPTAPVTGTLAAAAPSPAPPAGPPAAVAAPPAPAAAGLPAPVPAG